MFSDTESSYSKRHGMRRIFDSKAPRWEGESQVDEDAFLRMREEYLQMKRKEREDRQRMRELAAQLARTEEAAKRLMVRSDKSARGGAAARLLSAEKELCRVAADATEAHSKLRQSERSNRELKGRNAELKSKLEGALRDQRRLVVEVGKAERQRSRLGFMHQPQLQHALLGGGRQKDSSVQQQSPAQLSSPGSAAAKAGAGNYEHYTVEAPTEDSGSRAARALRKLKLLSLGRCESPRTLAGHGDTGCPEALQSLEDQVQEALHRAQALQQQLSAIQAQQQTPAGMPQQRQSISTSIAEQDPRQHPTAMQALWQTPSSSPQADPLGACAQQTGTQLRHGAVSAHEQAPGGKCHKDLHGEHTPDPGARAQPRSDIRVSPNHQRHTGSIAMRPSQSSEARDEGGQQLEAVHGPKAMRSSVCLWRRVCPGVEGWPDPERWLTIALHSVRLHPQHAQRHAHQRLFLMYSFLPGLCPAEQQCTHSLPATDTLLTFQHVQAYDIRGEKNPTSGAYTGIRSHACTSSQLVVPVCLVRQSPDLARVQHQQVGICSLNLEDCVSSKRVIALPEKSTSG